MERKTINAMELMTPADMTEAEAPPLFKWWYRGPRARAYLCRRRTEEVVAAIEEVPAGGLVLDLGSSWGLAAMTARAHGQRAVALDLAEEDIRAGAKIARANGLTIWFVRGDAAALPFRDGVFDAVVAVEAVEHIYADDRPTAFAEMARVLKDGGILSLSTPNRASPAEFAKRLALRYSFMGKLLRYTHMPAGPMARAVYHPHQYHEPFTRKALEAAVANAAFALCETRVIILMYKYCPDALFRIALGLEWLWERTPVMKNSCMTTAVRAVKIGPNSPVANEDVGPGQPRTVTVTNGTFTDTFHGEDVHIYKFTKPTRFGE